MKVSPDKPFQIVYGIQNSELFGYVYEAYVIQCDAAGRLSLTHQSVSKKNAKDFAKKLSEKDFDLIGLIDDITLESVMLHFLKKKIDPIEFKRKYFDSPNAKDEVLKTLILEYVNKRKRKIIELLKGKMLFEIAYDGAPDLKRKIEFEPELAHIEFHFYKNLDHTQFNLIIKLKDSLLDLREKGSTLIFEDPAVLLYKGKIIFFKIPVEGTKLKAFFSKKFIKIPQSVEAEYYPKFIRNLIFQYPVYPHNFSIKVIEAEPQIKLVVKSIEANSSLFVENSNAENTWKIDCVFNYQGFTISSSEINNQFSVIYFPDTFSFVKIKRNINLETEFINALKTFGWPTKFWNWMIEADKGWEFLDVVTKHVPIPFLIDYSSLSEKLWLGESELIVNGAEDAHGVLLNIYARFGKEIIPEKTLRKIFQKGASTHILDNGYKVRIPLEWHDRVGDLFHFGTQKKEGLFLKLHHAQLIKDSKVSISESLNTQIHTILDVDQVQEASTSQDFHAHLRPYQQAGFSWMSFLENHKFGALLADEMGLGKTVQTIALLQNYFEKRAYKGTALLVLPTSLIHNWKAELIKFAPKLKVLTYLGTDRQKLLPSLSEYNIILSTYATIRIDTPYLNTFLFDYIVLDEAQTIKNPDAETTKAIKSLKTIHRLILTGTPIENSVTDLWSLMDFLNPGLLGTQQIFKNRFQIPIEKNKNQNASDRLRQFIHPFLMRRLKKQVVKDLPEKTITIYECDMSDEQSEVYHQTRQSYQNAFFKDEEGTPKKQMVIFLEALTRLRQIANHPKLIDPTFNGRSGKEDAWKEVMKSILEGGNKLLIFSQYVKHLSLIRAHIETDGISYAYLDGASKDREASVKKFQEDPECKVFLLSLKAGGVGLNLTAAQYVFIMDPWWNPAVEAQAIDRTHRIGQSEPVFVYRFVTKNSIEERVVQLQERKQLLSEDLVQAEEGFIKNLSNEDLKSLLS